MVLLVIDTQTKIMTKDLFNFDGFVTNIKTLIACAREHAVEVIYVRHDDGEQAELTKHKEGFDIYEQCYPRPHEKVFDKYVNSPFKESGLLAYLKDKQETDIIVTGLQSDYCINATVICAFEHDFHVYVPAYANTTVDNAYMSGEAMYHYYNDVMWNGRYATCIEMNTIIQKMKERT